MNYKIVQKKKNLNSIDEIGKKEKIIFERLLLNTNLLLVNKFSNSENY